MSVSETEIETIYGALEYAKWDKKIKQVDARHSMDLSLEDYMSEIKVRKEELRKSLVQTLREIEVNEKMSKAEFKSLEELIEWAKTVYGTGFEVKGN